MKFKVRLLFEKHSRRKENFFLLFNEKILFFLLYSEDYYLMKHFINSLLQNY